MIRVGDERRYVRAVEAAWSRIIGRPVVVSPREFEAVDGWRRRGIPLTVVLEVLAADGKRRSRRGPRALTFLSHAVDEAWLTIAAGRAATPSVAAAPARGDARREWADARDRSPEGSRLRALIERLLGDEARGCAPAILDDTLDTSLPDAVSSEILERAREESADALEPFRERMSDEEFRKTFDRALADRLRASLSLPRLALTR